MRKDIAEWVRANARPGDFLHLEPEPEDGVELGLEIVPGSTGSAEDSAARHTTIAVRSDWTDPRGLVGYEMNLARVEYYLSDFLSALESGEPLALMEPGAADESAAGQEGAEVELPAALEIPPNVSFIGTVNVDETTHPFSPKVLDRANVIEFNEVDVERALGHGDRSPDAGLRLAGGTLDPTWLCTSREDALAAKARAHETEVFTGALEDVHGILARFDLHFGYRVIDEISAFVGHSLRLRPDIVLRSSDGRLNIFDAKLKRRFLGATEAGNDGPGAGSGDTFKPEDLHKMHAYRDALCADSVWVLYPGEERRADRFPAPGEPPEAGPPRFRGVGALALRPGASDDGELGELLAELA